MLVFNKSLSNSHLQTAEALDRERGGKGKEGSKKPKTNKQVCKYSSNKAKQACIKKNDV